MGSELRDCWKIGYIAGIIDAEASFSVAIKRQDDLRCKVRVQPVFSITQENPKPLAIIRDYFGCGRIMPKPGQQHLYLYIIDSLSELSKCFLAKASTLRLIAKKSQLGVFKEIIDDLAMSMRDRSDCCKIRNLVYKAYELSRLSSKSSRKRGLGEIIKLIPCGEAGRPPGER